MVENLANQYSASLRARFASGDHVIKLLHSERSERETELMRSAVRVMVRVGAQRLSLRQVAEEAGVSNPLLVYYFGSKENLLLESMRWLLSRAVRLFEESFAGVDDPKDALEAFMGAVFVNARSNREYGLVYIDLVGYGARNPSFRGLAELLREHATQSFEFVVRQGVEAGVFRVDDIRDAAEAVRALVEGMLILWLQDPNWKKTHKQLREKSYQRLLVLLGAA